MPDPQMGVRADHQRERLRLRFEPGVERAIVVVHFVAQHPSLRNAARQAAGHHALRQLRLRLEGDRRRDARFAIPRPLAVPRLRAPLTGPSLALSAAAAQLSLMVFPPAGVSTDVAERQLDRYRSMTAAEKLACADALWDLVWDATKAGVRMRHPNIDDSALVRDARAIIRRAAD